jgi:hypothetical protein
LLDASATVLTLQVNSYRKLKPQQFTTRQVTPAPTDLLGILVALILFPAGKNVSRVELARRVLETLILGDRVSTSDALQLRNWALSPEDSMLPLEEIAIRILNDDKRQRAKGFP